MDFRYTADQQELRRFELADPPVGGHGRRHVAERQIRVDGRRAPFAPDARIAEQGPRVGREDDPVIRKQSEVQRADAKVVARQHEPAMCLVPDGAHEWPAQT